MITKVFAKSATSGYTSRHDKTENSSIQTRNNQNHLLWKHLTAFLLMFVFFICGNSSAWGIGVRKTVSLTNVGTADKGALTDGTLSWTLNYSNLISLNDLNGKDLSQYDQIVLETSDLVTGPFRCMITSGGKDFTWTMYSAGKKSLALKNVTADNEGFRNNGTLISEAELSNVTSVSIGGASNEGSIKVTGIYLLKNFDWDGEGKITITPQYLNYNGTSISSSTVTYSNQYNDINILFDEWDAKTQLKDITVNETHEGSHEFTKWYCSANGNVNSARSLSGNMNKFMYTLNSATAPAVITLESIVLTRNPIVTFSSNNNEMGTVAATVNGNSITSGAFVTAGTEVTFTATPIGTNLIYNWSGGDYHQKVITKTVNTDYSVVANFTKGITINAYTNDGKLGTVNIQHWQGSGTSIHIAPNPGDVKFTATPLANGVFKGWYTSSGHTSIVSEDAEYTKTDLTDQDYNLFAKFEYSPDFIFNLGAKGNSVQSWENGVLTVKGATDNWVSVKNLDGYSNNYTGFNVTVQGDASRIIVLYRDSEGIKQVIKKVDAAATATTIYYSWSMLGVPDAQKNNITEIRFAGASDYSYSESSPGTTTFSNAELVNVSISHQEQDEPNDRKFDLSSNANFYSGFNHGDLEWTYKEVSDGTKYATLKSASTKNNQMEVFNFNGYTSTGFTGVRIISKGEHYRIIAHVNDGTEDGKNYIKEVPATDSKDYHHIAWSEFIKQWGNTTMTDDDIEKIDRIMVAGCSTHSQEEAVDFYSIMLDKMPTNTIFTDNSDVQDKYNHGTGDLSYSLTINGLTTKVNFNKLNGDDRANDCNGVKLKRGTADDGKTYEMRVTAPTGYKVSKVKVGFGHEDSHYNVSFNGGAQESINTGIYVEYTNNVTEGEYKDCVRMVIRSQSTSEEEKELHIKYVTFELETTSINESRQVTTSGAARDYWLYVPAKAIQNPTAAYPVVFSLHGTGNDYVPTGGGVQNFNELAEEKGFIVVYPRGRDLSFPGWGGTARGWEATGNVNQDITYFKDIVTALDGEKTNAVDGRKFTISKDEVYITGYSNGGMMAYAAANCATDVFAAFASVSGIPVNEMHHRHHGSRPVPFLHIHGKNDTFVDYRHLATIKDNMAARNGLPYTPILTNNYGNVHYYEYSASGKQPLFYYEVDGMGHESECTINGEDSKLVIWKFFSSRKKTNLSETEYVFEPQMTTANYDATQHGWLIKDGSRILCQYGESGGTNKTNQNVYHSLQLGGVRYINLTSTNSASDKYINVRLVKLGDMSHFDNLMANGFSLENTDVVNENHKANAGEIVIKTPELELGEYQLIISKGGQADETTISDLSITTSGTATKTKVEKEIDTDFTGYFNYNNRLFAQWNFDMCDGFRFNAKNLDANVWSADYSNTNTKTPDATFGTVVYTYKPAIGPASDKNDYDSYKQLTYDGSSKIIPIAAGLRFMAPTNSIKVQVELANGQTTATHLVVSNGVNMLVPYVQNSYRNDKGEAASPQDHLDDFKNCMHHIKRDILYVALSQGDILGKINNKCINDDNQNLFGVGGEEHVNGKSYMKCDYRGYDGVPCIIQFNQEAIIDRIGVNRNLTYSFYTEYINELGYSQPKPGFKIIGSPTGAIVANSGNHATYTNAIGMTYGGWRYNDNEYKDNNGTSVTDQWGELGVYNGNENFYTWADMPQPFATNDIPVASDGFPVFSRSTQKAYNENVYASADKTYHPQSNGAFNTNYEQNVTPWTLPCRGAYVKFEPTIPGVLNVHLLQMKDAKYYIADEFGKLMTADVFHKTASGATINVIGNGFVLNGHSDYAKYTFNVYPGKTYYIFSNEAGMGLTGFFFEPYVYRAGADETSRIDVDIAQLDLSENENYNVNPSSLSGDYTKQSPTGSGYKDYNIKKDHRAVKVSMTRNFTLNAWNAICLPYSINNTQMEEQFGKGTQVVLLRDVQPGTAMPSGLTTANFVYHANQDIIAGYPYLIFPTGKDAASTISNGKITKITTNAYIPETTAEIVHINGQGKNIVTGSGNFTTTGIGEYDFYGNFSSENLPENSYVVASNGNLTRLAKTQTAKPYRAFLKYTEKQQGGQQNAKLLIRSMNFDDFEPLHDETTDIEDMLYNSGILSQPADVYNMSGVKVRSNTLNLQGLSKGVYIVNGKKYIVK